MARIARVVAGGYPHHVTQRGNRRQAVFFKDGDYEAYLDLMAEWCARHEVEIWSYCLMPNHVHLMALPHDRGGLAKAIGEAHRRYTRLINFRERWRGYLWQGRFASFPLEGVYALACARYIELNPVRAGLVSRPGDWRWSSARAHLKGKGDKLVNPQNPLGGEKEWASLLKAGADEGDLFRRHERTGRPLGSPSFVKALERKLGRSLLPQKPGRKKLPEEK